MAQTDSPLVPEDPDTASPSPEVAPVVSSPPPSITGASSAGGDPVLAPAAPVGGPGTGVSDALWNWGPVQVRPHFNYRLYYASKVYVRPGQTQDTLRHSISPGLLLQTTHLSVDYTPTLNYYSKGRFDDHLDHNVSLNANYAYGDWRFSLGHDYSKSSHVLIETARQTDLENHTTALNASYFYTDRTWFDFNLTQAIVDTANLNDYRQWSTMNWINYALSESTTIGAGLGGGFSDVSSGADMTYERIMGRVGWTPGSKLSLSVNGGIEIRQFLDGASDRVNPIMSASMSYRIADGTTFGIEAERSVNTSLLRDRITENSGVSARLSQRFFGRLNAAVSAGYRNVEYQESSRTSLDGRTDDIVSVGVSLGTAFLERGYTSVGYRYLENESTAEGFGFTSNQYTFQIGYRF